MQNQTNCIQLAPGILKGDNNVEIKHENDLMLVEETSSQSYNETLDRDCVETCRNVYDSHFDVFEQDLCNSSLYCDFTTSTADVGFGSVTTGNTFMSNIELEPCETETSTYRDCTKILKQAMPPESRRRMHKIYSSKKDFISSQETSIKSTETYIIDCVPDEQSTNICLSQMLMLSCPKPNNNTGSGNINEGNTSHVSAGFLDQVQGTNNSKAFPKYSQPVIKNNHSVNNRQIVSMKRQQVTKNTKLVTKHSQPVIKDNHSVKNRQIVSKKRQQVTKNTKLVIKHTQPVIKDNHSVKNRQIVGKIIQHVTKNNKLVTKPSQPVIKGIHSVKNRQIVSKKRQQVSKSNKLVTKQIQPVIKDYPSVAKQRQSVTKKRQLVTKNRKSVTKESQPVTKNGQSVTEKNILTIVKSRKSVAENRPKVPRNHKYMSEESQPAIRDDRSYIQNHQPANGNNQTAVENSQPVAVTQRVASSSKNTKIKSAISHRPSTKINLIFRRQDAIRKYKRPIKNLLSNELDMTQKGYKNPNGTNRRNTSDDLDEFTDPIYVTSVNRQMFTTEKSLPTTDSQKYASSHSKQMKVNKNNFPSNEIKLVFHCENSIRKYREPIKTLSSDCKSEPFSGNYQPVKTKQFCSNRQVK